MDKQEVQSHILVCGMEGERMEKSFWYWYFMFLPSTWNKCSCVLVLRALQAARKDGTPGGKAAPRSRLQGCGQKVVTDRTVPRCRLAKRRVRVEVRRKDGSV